jgi:Fe-S cluster assembly protein SufD
VPAGVRVEKPIQAIYLIDEPGTVQYGQTLVVAGENSDFSVREYFLGTNFEGQALHAGAFELYAGQGARVKVAHFQDWGTGDVYDISTRRVEIGRDAFVTWVPIHLGGRLTKQTLDIITAEQGSDMKHTGLYFTEGEEHLDLFTTDRHEAGHTAGDTVWKGALTGNSRASYEGLIEITPGAQETHTYLQTHSMLLSQKAKADAIPSLIVETDNVSASHGGTVGELDEDQIFYMESRGIPRAEAVRVLVEGYFEEVVQRLDDPGLEELVRERIARKLAAAEDQVAEFIGERAES